jgi:hypothetical protein
LVNNNVASEACSSNRAVILLVAICISICVAICVAIRVAIRITVRVAVRIAVRIAIRIAVLSCGTVVTFVKLAYSPLRQSHINIPVAPFCPLLFAAPLALPLPLAAPFAVIHVSAPLHDRSLIYEHTCTSIARISITSTCSSRTTASTLLNDNAVAETS